MVMDLKDTNMTDTGTEPLTPDTENSLPEKPDTPEDLRKVMKGEILDI